MATLQGMSGLDLRSLTAELGSLLPLWIQKVYQIGQKTMVIRLHGEERRRATLLVEAGVRVHLTRHPLHTPTHPPQFAMLLRKYLTGGRILAFSQPGLQRILVIDVRKKEQCYHLALELFDEGNVVLCDEEFRIVKPLWHHRFKDREVVPGALYSIPGENPVDLPREEFISWLSGQPRDIVRTLATGAMLGGKYAEHVVSKAGIAKETPSADADGDAIYHALHDLLSLSISKVHPVITPRECLPFPLGSDTPDQSEFPDFSSALDAFYPPPVAPAEATGSSGPGAPVLSREQAIRRQQEAAIGKFQGKIDRLGRSVERIYEHYQDVAAVIDILGRASATHSWQEIGRILARHKEGPAGRIVAIHPAEAAVDLDLGERVTIHVHESVEANIGRYYDQIKKLKRKVQGAEAAMGRAIAPPPPRREGPGPQKRRWYSRFRWSLTSDRILIVGGRDASQNDELVKKYLQGGDLFLHADIHGASVVIVKGTTAHMDEAAQFAASYSGAWKGGRYAADVYMVPPSQVSKTPESGEYLGKGGFIVRGERTYFRNVPLGLAIGIVTGPEPRVIGGPVASVAAFTRTAVEIRPGRYAQPDMARKVLKALRGKIGEQESQRLKGILNSDRIVSFIPAGGSEIVGADESGEV